MAKFVQQVKKVNRHVITITTPSVFGSHKSMVVSENDDGSVVCRDDRGEYVTAKDRLDNGLADPNRNNFVGRKL